MAARRSVWYHVTFSSDLERLRLMLSDDFADLATTIETITRWICDVVGAR